jgi:uncharacterized protein (TIGR02757 family)
VNPGGLSSFGPPASRLHARLNALRAASDPAQRVQRDPVRVPHRYQDPADVEVAALFGALLAFGKVDLFLQVLDAWCDLADRRGGPAAYAASFDVERDGPDIARLAYRWTRGPDLALLTLAVGDVVRAHGSLGAVFVGADAAGAITTGATALRDAAVARSGELGTGARAWSDLPLGLRHLMPLPADGSACKRWNLLLRWMVRPADGVDLGLWRHLDPARLVIPLDRHVSRIAPLIGLVPRCDGSWRSAVAVTDALRAFAPDDPTRYDFALAHLGISGGCVGRFHPDVCPACDLRPVCVAALTPTAPPPTGRTTARRGATRR